MLSFTDIKSAGILVLSAFLFCPVSPCFIGCFPEPGAAISAACHGFAFPGLFHEEAVQIICFSLSVTACLAVGFGYPGLEGIVPWAEDAAAVPDQLLDHHGKLRDVAGFAGILIRSGEVSKAEYSGSSGAAGHCGADKSPCSGTP